MDKHQQPNVLANLKIIHSSKTVQRKLSSRPICERSRPSINTGQKSADVGKVKKTAQITLKEAQWLSTSFGCFFGFCKRPAGSEPQPPALARSLVRSPSRGGPRSLSSRPSRTRPLSAGARCLLLNFAPRVTSAARRAAAPPARVPVVPSRRPPRRPARAPREEPP